MRLRNSSL